MVGNSNHHEKCLSLCLVLVLALGLDTSTNTDIIDIHEWLKCNDFTEDALFWTKCSCFICFTVFLQLKNLLVQSEQSYIMGSIWWSLQCFWKFFLIGCCWTATFTSCLVGQLAPFGVLHKGILAGNNLFALVTVIYIGSVWYSLCTSRVPFIWVWLSHNFHKWFS